MRPPVRVKWHDEQGFAPKMPDDEWLHVVGPRGWVVLSQDRKFHAIDVQAEAIKQHKIRCYYLPCASQHRWVTLCHFVRRHEKFIALANTVPAPFIYDLKGNGQFYPVKLP